MLIIDEFNFTSSGNLAEVCAKTLCAMRGKDPSATNNTGNQEWISFLPEVRAFIALFSLCEKALVGAVHKRIIHNGHTEVQIVDALVETANTANPD